MCKCVYQVLKTEFLICHLIFSKTEELVLLFQYFLTGTVYSYSDLISINRIESGNFFFNLYYSCTGAMVEEEQFVNIDLNDDNICTICKLDTDTGTLSFCHVCFELSIEGKCPC